MASEILVLTVVLATASASRNLDCPRNTLREGVRNERRGNRLLLEMHIEMQYYDLILWCVADATTTYITDVNVSDNIGLCMTATPYLHLGGPNHAVVGIRFRNDNSMQIAWSCRFGGEQPNPAEQDQDFLNILSEHIPGGSNWNIIS